MKIGKAAFKSRLATFDASVSETLRELAALPPQQFRAILPVLANAQREVGRDLKFWLQSQDMSERFTAQRYRELLVQLESALDEVKKLNPAMYDALVKGNRAARAMSLQHLRREASALSQKFAGSIGSPIPIARAARIAEGSGALLKHYARTARRYAGDVGQDIRGQLALGVVRKETMFEMTNRLVAQGGPKGLIDLGTGEEYIAEGLFRRYRYWAQRVVRTEVIESYNAAASDGIKELHKIDPEILTRWDASLDGRMCALCESLHGKTVKPGELFPDGIDHPPLHPNCRCALTAWREDWG